MACPPLIVADREPHRRPPIAATPQDLSFFSPEFVALHVPVLTVLAACLGSFYNVCIYRIPRGVKLSYPGSHCYRCGQPVRWYDNLPLFSYWILGGRCRWCGAGFSIRYFLVELLTTALLMLAVFHLGYSLAIIPAWIFISLLIVGTFTDLDHWIIPDRVTLGGLAAGLVLAAIPPVAWAPGNPLVPEAGSLLREWLAWAPADWLPLVNAMLGALAGWTMLWGIGVIGTLIFRKDAMGLGDVKLFGMFGAFTGLAGLLPILVIACMVGSVVGIVGIQLGRRAAGEPADPLTGPLNLDADARRHLLDTPPLTGEERAIVERELSKPGAVGTVRHHLPFGPSLSLAALIVFLYRDAMMEWIFRVVYGGPGF